MRIVITGGAGFIGSAFARMCVGLGHEVLVLDALTYAGNLANLESVRENPRYTFVRADVRDTDICANLLTNYKPDAVTHFAAESHVDRSIIDASPFVSANVGGTQSMLDALRRSGVKARFLQVSTDEVYGSADDGKPFTEESPLKPSSPYAASKTAADLFVLAYRHTHGMDTLITRCSNNYGPCQFPEKMIPLFTANLMDGGQIPVYGDGMQVRDWIHCDDHARGVLAVLERGQSGRVYNLGGGNPLPNLHVARLLMEFTGRGEDAIRHVTDRPGHDRAYMIDYSRAEKELGWRPLVSFREGLAATVEWYKSNTGWLNGVRSGAYRDYYQKQYGSR